MKRIGNLFPAICDPDNLRLAWLKTRRGKSQSPAVVQFAQALEANLHAIGHALRSGDWRPGPFRSFEISDPKPRTISAAPLADRVVHHAIMNVLDPIIDSYHCTPGRGIPIGNLTSQYIANLYLSQLDHLILDAWQPGAYIRYMDDMVFWSDDARRLQNIHHQVASWLADQRLLQLKPAVAGPVGAGLPFLGFRITAGAMYLAQKSKRRYRRNYLCAHDCRAVLYYHSQGEVGP